MRFKLLLSLLLISGCDDSAASIPADGAVVAPDVAVIGDSDAMTAGPDAGPAGPCPVRLWEAPGSGTTTDFLIDSGGLYLAVRDEGAARSTLWRVPKDGGDGVMLADEDRAAMLHLDGDWLYFEQGATPMLARVDKGGGAVETLFPLPMANMRGHDDYLYGAAGDHLVELFKVDGTVTRDSLGSGAGWNAVDAVDAAAVYVRTGGELIAISRGDGSSNPVLTNVADTGMVNADAQALYLNRTDGLSRWTADLGPRHLMDDTADEVALGTDHAYYQQDGEIHRIVKYGGPGHLILATGPVGEGHHIAVDSARVYWAVDVAGTPEVWAAARGGCD